MNKLFSEVKNAAYEIINRKGYTDTAIGSVVARLSKAILEDEKTVFPVSVRLDGEYSIDNVCLSLPSVMGIHGVESKILVNVSEYEHNKLIESAEYLKSYLINIRLD